MGMPSFLIPTPQVKSTNDVTDDDVKRLVKISIKEFFFVFYFYSITIIYRNITIIYKDKYIHK